MISSISDVIESFGSFLYGSKYEHTWPFDVESPPDPEEEKQEQEWTDLETLLNTDEEPRPEENLD